MNTLNPLAVRKLVNIVIYNKDNMQKSLHYITGVTYSNNNNNPRKTLKKANFSISVHPGGRSVFRCVSNYDLCKIDGNDLLCLLNINLQFRCIEIVVPPSLSKQRREKLLLS